jgi:hypothetical protein
MWPVLLLLLSGVAAQDCPGVHNQMEVPSCVVSQCLLS